MILCISATGSESVAGSLGIVVAAAAREKAEIVADSYRLTEELTGSALAPNLIAVAAAIVIVESLEYVVEYLKVAETTRKSESNILIRLEHSVVAEVVAVVVVVAAAQTIQSWYPFQ